MYNLNLACRVWMKKTRQNPWEEVQKALGHRVVGVPHHPGVQLDRDRPVLLPPLVTVERHPHHWYGGDVAPVPPHRHVRMSNSQIFFDTNATKEGD